MHEDGTPLAGDSVLDALTGRYLTTVSLSTPNVVATAMTLVTSDRGGVKPCSACMGTGSRIEPGALEMLVDACIENSEFLESGGLLGEGVHRLWLPVVKANLRDILDTHAPVLLLAPEVFRLYNSYLAISYDVQKRLAGGANGR